MSATIQQLSGQARQAMSVRDWARVKQCAADIIALDQSHADGWYLQGLCLLAASQARAALSALQKALELDPQRFDAATELAGIYWQLGRHGDATQLLDSIQGMLSDSAVYLFKSAETYTRLGLHAKAWPQYLAANRLQAGVPAIEAGLASCATKVGEVDQAIEIYDRLLAKNPQHQRNHYERARLTTAQDDTRVRMMQAALEKSQKAAHENIFINFALAKELEDLGRWEESFEHYQAGADAAHMQCLAAGYTVSQDIALLEKIPSVCDSQWLNDSARVKPVHSASSTPIFVLGLPRTGTTLVEKIISAHSRVETADESFFLELAIKRASKLRSVNEMSPSVIAAAAGNRQADIGNDYLHAIAYRLKGHEFFVEKYPFNFLYIGFIAKYFPHAKIVLLSRAPIDACFAMYKQPFFKFSYAQQDLVEYHAAYQRLIQHWRALIPSIVEIQYEDLVADPARQIPTLLKQLGLEFEQGCVDYHENITTSATASSVQVREKPHTRSVGKWRHWQKQLQVLREGLEGTPE